MYTCNICGEKVPLQKVDAHATDCATALVFALPVDVKVSIAMKLVRNLPAHARTEFAKQYCSCCGYAAGEHAGACSLRGLELS